MGPRALVKTPKFLSQAQEASQRTSRLLDLRGLLAATIES